MSGWRARTAPRFSRCGPPPVPPRADAMIPPVRPNVLAMAGYTPGEQPREDGIIKLNTNENPYPPSPRVFEAIRAALTGDRLRKYPDPSGTHFRQTAGRILGVDPDGILIGNGSDDVLTILTRAFVPEGGLIVAPTPSYVLYKSLAEIQGARFEAVRFEGDWQPDVRNWPRDAHLYFVPNPNSPTGTVLDPVTVLRMSNATNPRPFVIDEAYADFAEAPGYVSLI